MLLCVCVSVSLCLCLRNARVPLTESFTAIRGASNPNPNPNPHLTESFSSNRGGTALLILDLLPVLLLVHLLVHSDQGWNSIGFHNPSLISPNINELVKDGTYLELEWVTYITWTSYPSDRPTLILYHVNLCVLPQW